MGKGIKDDVHTVLLEGIYNGPEDPSDVIYYLNRYLQKLTGYSLYDLLGANGVEDVQRVALLLGQNHTKLWKWSRDTMSFKLR